MGYWTYAYSLIVIAILAGLLLIRPVRAVTAKAVYAIAAFFNAALGHLADVGAKILAPASVRLDRLFGVYREPSLLSAKTAAIWFGGNFALLLLSVAIAGTWAGALISLFLVAAELSFIFATFLAADRDYDVWDGLIKRKEDPFADCVMVKSLPLMAMTSVLLVFSGAALCMNLELGHQLRLLNSHAIVSCQGNVCNAWKYLLSTFHVLPFGDLLYTVLGIPQETAAKPVITATIAEKVLYLSVWVWALGIYKTLRMLLRDVEYLMTALAEEHKGDRDAIQYLQWRAARAPASIKSHLLHRAIYDPNDVNKKRAISVARFAKIYTFPQTFFYNLHTFTTEVRRHGLFNIEQMLDLLARDNEKFDAKTLKQAIKSISHQQANHADGFSKGTRDDLNTLMLRFWELAVAAGPAFVKSNKGTLAQKHFFRLAKASNPSGQDQMQMARQLAKHIDPAGLIVELMANVDLAKIDSFARDDATFASRLSKEIAPAIKPKDKKRLRKVQAKLAHVGELSNA